MEVLVNLDVTLHGDAWEEWLIFMLDGVEQMAGQTTGSSIGSGT